MNSMDKMPIGIDEAGRGPIAGPVSVAIFEPKVRSLKGKVKSLKIPLRDSKKLTLKQREAWFAQIKKWKRTGICNFAVSLVSAEVIDRIGIVRAINTALICCLNRLRIKDERIILLDGSLHAPAKFKNQKTIIKGDEKIQVITLASIVAKVHRDRHMVRLAKKIPGYGFEIHKGYGTRGHYRKLAKHGLSKIHRRSFLKAFV